MLNCDQTIPSLEWQQSQEGDTGSKQEPVPVRAFNLMKMEATNVLFPADAFPPYRRDLNEPVVTVLFLFDACSLESARSPNGTKGTSRHSDCDWHDVAMKGDEPTGHTPS